MNVLIKTDKEKHQSLSGIIICFDNSGYLLNPNIVFHKHSQNHFLKLIIMSAGAFILQRMYDEVKMLNNMHKQQLHGVQNGFQICGHT